jgi:RNA polymerase sigma factor (sigma-70 family)
MPANDFEKHRPLLRAVAGRMLGSTAEADDAVQETWLRFSKADGIDNLESWLRTVVSRVSLDMLRSRKARREEPIDWHPPTEVDGPEHEALLIDEVGRAMLVVLDRLSPAERVAFVLHDMFAVPFEEIASTLSRTTVTTKKLASRARQRVRGAEPRQRADKAVVEAFLKASREGDLEALLTILAPDVVRTADVKALPKGMPTTTRGRDAVAREMLVLGRRAVYAEPALVDGRTGAVVAPNGRLQLALIITVCDEQVVAYEVIADRVKLDNAEISLL